MTDVQYMSLNGAIVAAEEARVHILSPAMKFAASVFEGIRGYWNSDAGEIYLFRLDDHLKRLQFGMKVLRFGEDFSLEHLRRSVLEVIRANSLREDVYVRLYAYVDSEDGDMTDDRPVAMAVAATPAGRPPKAESGVTCQVSAWQKITDVAVPPRVKCVANYANGRLAWMQARADGYDNAILLSQRGKVAEAPGASIFVVRDGVPVTPGLTSDILESVTRRSVLALLGDHLGLAALVRDLDRSELYAADEAFLCGTKQEVLPVVGIDRHPLGDGRPGPLTRSLRERFLAVARGRTREYGEWRTAVYR